MGLKPSGWGIEVDKSKAKISFEDFHLMDLVSSSLEPETAIPEQRLDIKYSPDRIRYFTFQEDLDSETAKQRAIQSFDSKYFGLPEQGQSRLYAGFNSGYKASKFSGINELEKEIAKEKDELSNFELSWNVPFTKNYTKNKNFWNYVGNLVELAAFSAAGASSVKSFEEPVYGFASAIYFLTGIGATALYNSVGQMKKERKESAIREMEGKASFYKDFRRKLENSNFFVETPEKMKEEYENAKAYYERAENKILSKIYPSANQGIFNDKIIDAYQNTRKDQFHGKTE